jgi:hypothetical protein
MTEEIPFIPCRSKNTEDVQCIKKRGHTPQRHSNGLGGYWTGGINTPPYPYDKEANKRSDAERKANYHDDGYMSEGDYQSWGRIRY